MHETRHQADHWHGSLRRAVDSKTAVTGKTDDGGQFADRGSQYRTAILFHSEDQKKLAEISKKKIEEAKWFDRPIRTQILPYKNFYRAEDYHQDYYKKNPEHYKMYKYGSGRETFIQRVWGKI